MSQINLAWGRPPSADYEALAERFRPIFQRIRTGAVSRDLERRLPTEEIHWLREAGFTALRIPRSHGGSGIRISELFALLVELGEADSNVVQSLRAHELRREPAVRRRQPAPRALADADRRRCHHWGE